MARPGLANNVKFKMLCRMLGVPRPQARGILETLWDVAHESGNPVMGDPDAVEAAAEWWGERGVLFAALRDCRLIDDGEDGRWEIHDYWHHAPEYVQGRAAREQERQKSKVCAGCETVYHSSDHRARYCSSSCRLKHWRGVKRTETDDSVSETDMKRTDTFLKRTETDRNGTPSPSPSPSPSPGIKEEGCSEPDKPASEPPPSPIVMVFHVVGSGSPEWPLTEAKLNEYQQTYPGVDVRGECRRAWQWVQDHPAKRKTARGMPGFLSRWLGRAQDSGRGPPIPGNGKAASLKGMFEDLP